MKYSDVPPSSTILCNRCAFRFSLWLECAEKMWCPCTSPPSAREMGELQGSHDTLRSLSTARKKQGKPDEPAPRNELVPQSGLGLPVGYAELLEDLEARVPTAQVKAVNRELVRLYWDIGRPIVEGQEREGWGKGIVDRLAHDVQKAVPGLQGFSPRNVWRMRAFYLAYSKEVAILPQPATELSGSDLPGPFAEIPWVQQRRARWAAAAPGPGRAPAGAAQYTASGGSRFAFRSSK
jgi:hypothetical protein